jgi:hypothetical protein
MLRHKRLNEVIATDTYFSSDKSIGGNECAQLFFGMTTNVSYVTLSLNFQLSILILSGNMIYLLHSDKTLQNLK